MNNEIPVIDVEVYADHPILYMDLPDEVSDSTLEGSKYGLPEGPVIAQDKNMVESWMVDDFEAFVEMTEDLCEEDYGLILIYRHRNEDNLFRFSYLATDESGEVIENFVLRLQISNHREHSIKQRRRNKIQESQSEKLRELFKDKPMPKLRSYPIHITVNDDAYDSYDDAFEDFEQLLQSAVEVMHK